MNRQFLFNLRKRSGKINALSDALRLILLIGILLQPGAALAQSTAFSPWTVYKQEDGLASNNVLSIIVGDGVIWFGTDAGISRFDGSWTSYLSGIEMIDGRVNALAHASTVGQLWAGTDAGKVARWTEGRWQPIAEVPGAVQVLHDVDGQLWIGTDAGLFAWNGTEAVPVASLLGKSVHSLASQANTLWVGTSQGLWLRQQDNWSVITAADGLPGNEVTALWIDPNGPVWVGTRSGIAWRDPTTGTWTEIPTEDREGNPFRVQALTGDKTGEVWGGTDGNGAFRISGDGFLVPFSGDVGLTTPFVQAVAIDQDDSIWFGTASGVFRYDEKTWIKEQRDSVDFPGINFINALLVEPNNQLWIGTGGAGVRLKRLDADAVTAEQIFSTEDTELPADFVNALAMDSQGGIWAGTVAGVARYQEQAWTRPLPPDALPADMVNALLADRQYVWIGTEAGLARFDLNTETSTVISVLDQKKIRALAIDSLRRVWVGTLNSGVFVQESDGSWSQFVHDPENPNSLPGDSVVALSADPNFSGGMWVGVNRRGLSHWDGQNWQNYSSSSGLPSNLLYTFYTDPGDGSLWIGSEGGVTHYDGRTWETLTVKDILPTASIFSIARTPGGSYWFGGKDGLTYYHPERTAPWIRINDVAGAVTDLSGGVVEVEANTDVTVNFTAGDLHTDRADMKLLYRISGPGQIGLWQVTNNSQYLALPTIVEEGTYLVELQARDQAFNYSDIAKFTLKVVSPPATVDLPFSAPIRQDYFIALVITALLALIGFGYMSAEIMQNRRRTREALSRSFNPFISGEPVRREDMFFGRDDLLQRIVDTLHNNSIMIHGERRIGKTTLLYQLAGRLREVEDPEYWFVPLYIDLEGTTEDIFFHALMEEIINGVLTLPDADEQLQPTLRKLLYYSMPSVSYTDREFSRDLRQVIRLLQQYGAEYHPDKYLRLILLMDEMDVMSNYDRLLQQRLRRIFMRDFAATLGAVVAGIQISKEWDRIESPWYNLFNEIELKPFNRQQALELLTEPVEEYYHYDPAALEFIIEQSDGRPFRLQQYALEAVNHMLAAGRRQITLDDVEFAHQHIQDVGNDIGVGIDSIKPGESPTENYPEAIEEDVPLPPAS